MMVETSGRSIDEKQLVGSQQLDYGTTGRRSSRALTSRVTLAWRDVTVTVPSKRSFFTRKLTPSFNILKGVSGIVEPGSLLAIMGASGSGKTTLLNVLTQRISDDLAVSGEVLVNGKRAGPEISTMSAYVQQEDLFIGVLTVREHLWFQATLRLDRNVTNQAKEERIQDVLTELSLDKCQNAPIGTPGRFKSLSGGELKRLSFAAEILTKPALLFCDEATSGLDSFMAENVVAALRSLASAGRTILTTIHQPSSETFALFDRLLLLSEGRVIYLGEAKNAASFFMDNGQICPPLHNPADFFIRALAVVPDKEDESRQRLQKMVDNFKASKYNMEMKSLIDNSHRNDQNADGTQMIGQRSVSSFKASYWTQLRLVSWRSCVTLFRDVMIVRIRLMQNLFVGLLAGLIYLQQPNNQKGVQNINGALFMICANISFSNIFAVVTTFTSELALFKRDHENGTYRTSTYFIGKTIADLPIFVIGPVLYAVILYWMVGLKPDVASFFILVGAVILVTNVVVSFGSLVSSLAGDPAIGTALAGPLTVPFLLFGGYLINEESIPDYFVWLEYISWFKYGTEIFFVNQWHGFGEIGCEFDKNGTALSRCFRNGDEVLQSFGYSYNNLLADFIALLALLVGFRLLSYIFLLIRVNPIKKTLKHYWHSN